MLYVIAKALEQAQRAHPNYIGGEFGLVKGDADV